MKRHDTDRIGEHGGIDLFLIQKYINFHFSVSIDLFGSELSTNAATYYTAGLKGRFKEAAVDDDHVLTDASYPVLQCEGGAIVESHKPALASLNECLRDSYIADCERALTRWNRIISEAGVSFELKLPHRAFHRAIGTFSAISVTPEGQVISPDEWASRKHEWLPTREDTLFIGTLMRPETTPGAFAGWIAPPPRGINHQPIDFTYVTNLPD